MSCRNGAKICEGERRRGEREIRTEAITHPLSPTSLPCNFPPDFLVIPQITLDHETTDIIGKLFCGEHHFICTDAKPR